MDVSMDVSMGVDKARKIHCLKYSLKEAVLFCIGLPTSIRLICSQFIE